MNLENNCMSLTAKGARTCAAAVMLSSQIGHAMQSAPEVSKPLVIPPIEMLVKPELMEWECIPFDFSIKAPIDNRCFLVKRNCTCVNCVELA